MSFRPYFLSIAYRRQCLLTGCVVVLLFAVQDTRGAKDSTMNPVADFIRQDVKTFVNTLPGASSSVSVRPVKKTFPKCQKPLSIARQSGRRPPVGVVRVSVECPGDWRTYRVADVSVKVPAVFSRKNLARGGKVAADDLQIVATSWEQLRGHYFTQADELIGRELKRSLKAGKLMDTRVLVPKYLVRKGDSVVIQAGKGGLRISMAGVAMEDGLFEERIRVRNRSSGKVLDAIVLARGKVQVGP